MDSSPTPGAPRPLTDRQLADLFGCSRPYIIKLRQTKGMPAFTDPTAANDWRAIHAPPRGRRPENQIGKNRDEHPPQPPTGTEGDAAKEKNGGKSSSANSDEGTRIDIKSFIVATEDFEGLMLKQASAVPQIAYGLLSRACAGGDPVEVSAQLKNWADAGKVAGSVREKFLELQEKSRALLSLDEVEDVVGTLLQEVRSLMLRNGTRVAAALEGQLTDEQLRLVREKVDAATDEIFRNFDAVVPRTRRDLAS